MNFPCRLLLSWIVLTAPAMAQAKLPEIQAQSLTGKQVVLPKDASGEVTLLIFGFAHASKAASTAWGKKLNQDFASDNAFVFYQIAGVQDIPRLFRGMAEHGMRSEVPAARQDHFLLLRHDEARWKKFVGYEKPDDAYLVLLDRRGAVRDQWHGRFDAPEYQKLAKEIRAL